MNPELQKLLKAADEVSIRLRFVIEYVNSPSEPPEDPETWQNLIVAWEKELDELNHKILATWKAGR